MASWPKRKLAKACSKVKGQVPPLAAVEVQTGAPLKVVVAIGALELSKENEPLLLPES